MRNEFAGDFQGGALSKRPRRLENRRSLDVAGDSTREQRSAATERDRELRELRQGWDCGVPRLREDRPSAVFAPLGMTRFFLKHTRYSDRPAWVAGFRTGAGGRHAFALRDRIFPSTAVRPFAIRASGCERR